ncbi:DNA-binding protein [Chryseobacterium shigense]|uniref:DNA binding domain-containing protein, excisionase family n=1 Tax=Chryseobacterium shigense TaxID=297244 RepID=A0A1N7I0P4_9FLAO|nr:helix-turn-helix domain-containing protein [Chryseobacterium shigense]PQA90691.1 DNA-binding protein [Chryseobacterium shigense]SIS30665.1 DNA binding domain-containing protein, excisionase family [Chryseobacterium shigense]
MSSNIEIERICQHCNKDFIAKTTVTRYCSDDCAKRAYKARKRAEKIGVSVAEIQQIRQKPIEDLKAREFLTVMQVSKLIGCSKQNVYKLINTGKLKATNILIKKTIVKRSEIDKLFESKEKVKPTQFKPLEIAECYTISEVQEKFKVSQSAFQNIMKRNNIQKMQKGKFVYVPKVIINDIFK